MPTRNTLFKLLSALVSVLLLHGPIPALAADTLVQTIDTSHFVPPSPDLRGLAYLNFTNTLLRCDGEVDEMSIYAGANLFEMTPTDTLISTANTHAYSNEPVGCASNPLNGHLFITDDVQKRLYEIDPGEFWGHAN